jgi:uroporphyrinogen-III synthase
VEALRAAGARVDTVALYQSVARTADDPAIQAGLAALRAGQLHACAFFAPSQVRAIFTLLADEATVLLSSCPTIATIGTTTANALRERGVGVDVIPTQPTAAALASAIAERYQGPRGT